MIKGCTLRAEIVQTSHIRLFHSSPPLIALGSVLSLGAAAFVGVQSLLPAKEAIPLINIDGLLESVEHLDDVVIGIDRPEDGIPAGEISPWPAG